MRRALRYGVLALIGVVLLLGLALTWVLHSASGRDFVLARIAAALPPGALAWENVEGTLAGRLAIDGLQWRGMNGAAFDAARVELEAALLPLLSSTVALDDLRVRDARLALPVDDEPAPAEPLHWPLGLPTLGLPIDLRVARLQIDGFRLVRGEVDWLAIDQANGHGQLAGDRLAIESLRASGKRGALYLHGWIDSAADWRHEVAAHWSAPVATNPARLELRSQGDLNALTLRLDGQAPEPVELVLSLENGLGDTPRWTLRANAERIEPARLGLAAGAALRGRIDADGEGGEFALQGELARGDVIVAIAPSTLRYDGRRLRLDPLALDLLNGRLTLTGELDTLVEPLRADLVAETDGLRWQGGEGSVPVGAAGRFALAGTLDAWTVGGEATLTRAGEAATLTLDGRGDGEHLALATLRLANASGGLDGRGELHWSPRLAWNLSATLDRFDPSYLLPDWPGAIRGALASEGRLTEDDQLRLRVELTDLAGELRGEPLGGRVDLDWLGEQGELDADLRLGDSRVVADGTLGETLDLRARLDPLHLDDLFADAAGVLRGRIDLRGPPAAPAIGLRLDGSGLRWSGVEAAALDAEGRLPQHGEAGDLTLRLAAVEFGAQALDEIVLRLSGSTADLRAEVSARGEDARLEAVAQLARDAGWRGRLLDLELVPPQSAPWTLQNAGEFVWRAGAIALDRSCLAGADGGSLCASADWPQRAELVARDLPLALLDPWLALGEPPLSARGTVDIDAELRPGGLGEATLRAGDGSLQLATEGTREVFGYDTLAIDADWDPDALRLTAEAALRDGGRLDARLATGWSADSALDGEIDAQLHEITWLELLSPDVAAPSGRIDADLRLAGTRGAPQLSGEARLREARAELPALGVALQDAQATLRGNGGGPLRLTAQARSGEGRLEVEGTLQRGDDGLRLTAKVTGENVLAADTDDLRAVIAPDLQIEYAAQLLRLRGTVSVPSARIDLERLDTTTRPSPDVVVLDPVEPRERPIRVDTRLTVRLGDDVRLEGFGLDGKLSGELRLRDPPDRVATASGALQIDGRYRAYGRELSIQRGRLTWANNALDNPTLNVQAEREIGEVTVGLRVTGSALRPRSDVYSDPNMESSEALSYLVLGRPLRSASEDEADQLNAAALALGAGSNLIAQQVGARLGLDEAGVGDSRALGGATLTLGKYLSPRLFVSYGVSLLGAGQVLTLKYLLAHGFDVRIESGTESRASINWRTER